MSKKLGEFTTPTGAKGNVFNLSDIGGLVLGGVVLIFSVAAAQNIANKFSSKVPVLDSKIENPFAPTTVIQNPQRQIQKL